MRYPRLAMLLAAVTLTVAVAVVPAAFATYREDVMEPTPTPGGGCVVVSGGSGVGGTDSTDDSGLTGSGCIDSWVLTMLLSPGPVGGGPSAPLPPNSTQTCLLRIAAIDRAPDGTIVGADLEDLSSPRCPQQPAAWISEVSARLRDIIRQGCDEPGQRIQFDYSVNRSGVPHSPRNFVCIVGPREPVG